VRGERCLAPQPWGNLSVVGLYCVCGIRLIVSDHDAALLCGVVAPGAGVIGVAEPVVRGVEEPLEHHWVGDTGKVPLRVSVRSGGLQLVGGALGRLVAGGGARIPCGQDMAARVSPACRSVGVGGGNIRRCSAAQTDGEARS
jgi:hypothetical protein